METIVLPLGRIQAAIASEAPSHDIARVYLFGSYARGEAHASSDLDICLETGPAFSLLNAGDLSSRLEESRTCVPGEQRLG